jgi:hypothetical protein
MSYPAVNEYGEPLTVESQRIEIPANGGLPALMLFSERLLSPASIANILGTIGSNYKPGRILIFEPGLKVFQCVGGIWSEINPKAKIGFLDLEEAEDENAALPPKVNFREFT